MRNALNHTRASWVAAVLFLAGAAALLWTAWSPAWSWLVVAAGMLGAAFVTVLLVERR